MSDHGTITRVSGPIVHASGLADAMMYEVVEVSRLRLIGEVIRLRGDLATIQVYEDTTGVQPGEPVRRTGEPLSLSLGPGLIGSIYDGIQRPLPEIARESGSFIRRGEKVPPLPADKLWHFVPAPAEGAEVAAGHVLGTVQETPCIEHRVLCPPGVSGTLATVAKEGDYKVSEMDHHRVGDDLLYDEPHYSRGVPLLAGGYLKAITPSYQKVRIPLDKLLPKGTYFLRWHTAGIGLSAPEGARPATYFVDLMQVEP